MKICILSDSHDRRDTLTAAVADAKTRGAELVLHCGDIIAPSTLHAITPIGLPSHVIHGNNMGDTYALGKMASNEQNKIFYHGQDAALEFHGRRIFIVHYPHYAKAMALAGDYDLVCSGHEHRAHIDTVKNSKGGETIWLNPGTVGAVHTAPATYVLGDLEKMEFEILDVPLA